MIRSKKVMVVILGIIIVIVLLAFVIFSSADRSVLFGRAMSFDYDGTKRTYRIYVPKDTGSERKLIFAFHGYGSNGWQMAYTTGLHNSSGNNAIVVYPDASNPTEKDQRTGWNAGFCCGSGYVNKIDDVGFIKELAGFLAEKYHVQQNQIYAAGFSNGGMFVNRLATELPSMFHGYASVAGSIGTKTNSLNPNTPAAMLLIHGEDDKNVPYDGGPGASDSSFKWLSFADTKAAWERANKTSEPSETTRGNAHFTVYARNVDPLKTITYSGIGHEWPGWRLTKFWRKQTEGSRQVVKFFNQL